MKLVDLEKEKNNLQVTLAHPASERSKLRALNLFFHNANSHFSASELLSYYLEFSDALCAHFDVSGLVGWSPHELKTLSDLFSHYRLHLNHQLDINHFEEAARDCQLALAAALINLQEWKQVWPLLENLTLTHISPKSKNELTEITNLNTQLSTCKKELLAYCDTNKPAICGPLRAILEKWQVAYDTPSQNKIPVLLVEQNPSLKTSDPHGALHFLKLVCHPAQLSHDEDIIWINQQTFTRNTIPLSGFQDTVQMARRLIAASDDIKPSKAHYSFHFVLPDPGAQYTGSSWNASLSVLAYTSMINTFFHQPKYKLAQDTVMTGAIDNKGNLTQVDPDGLKSKIITAFYSPIKRILVPQANLTGAAQILSHLTAQYPNRHLSIESVENLYQLIESRNVLVFTSLKLRTRIWGWIRKHIKKLAWAFTTTVLVLALIPFDLIYKEFLMDSNPYDFEFMDKDLIMKNRTGDVLWTAPLNVSLKRSYYLTAFQNALFANIDTDSMNEFFIGVYSDVSSNHSGTFFVFDDDGTELLRRKTGEALNFGTFEYKDHYRIRHIDLKDLNGDGELEILTAAVHWPFYPCCINVWSMSGDKLSTYWHSGHLDQFKYYDFDGDGLLEILIGGQNNGYKSAVLAVLPPFGVEGTSPQEASSNYYCADLPRARERMLIRFPQTQMYKLTGSRDYVYHIEMEDTRIRIALGNGSVGHRNNTKPEFNHTIYYYFDYRMNCIELSISDAYKIELRDLTGGRIEESKTDLLKIQYYDGTNWITGRPHSAF